MSKKIKTDQFDWTRIVHTIWRFVGRKPLPGQHVMISRTAPFALTQLRLEWPGRRVSRVLAKTSLAAPPCLTWVRRTIEQCGTSTFGGVTPTITVIMIDQPDESFAWKTLGGQVATVIPPEAVGDYCGWGGSCWWLLWVVREQVALTWPSDDTASTHEVIICTDPLRACQAIPRGVFYF